MCELGATPINANENPPARKYKRDDEAFQRSPVEHWLLAGKSRLGTGTQRAEPPKMAAEVQSPASRISRRHTGGVASGEPAAAKGAAPDDAAEAYR